MAALASDAAAAPAEAKSVQDETTQNRLKRIREQQREGNLTADVMIEYPATVKGRRGLTSESNCPEVFVVYTKPAIYDRNENGEKVTLQEARPDTESDIVDCFKLGLKFIPEISHAIKAAEHLQKKDSKNKSKKIEETIPIYLINAHSAVEPRVSLEAIRERFLKEAKHKNMPVDDLIKEEQEYSIIDQITNYKYDILEDGRFKEGARFSMNIAPSKYNVKYASRTDFFNTKPNSGVYIIETSPVGFDASCGDKNTANFFVEASKDGFKTFREIVFSPNFDSLFVKPQDEDEDKINFFTPPGYSALNKAYQFFDVKGEKSKGWDKWGILKISDIVKSRPLTKRDFRFKEPIKVVDRKAQMSALHPETMMLKEIRQSIINNNDISLKDIVNKLGKGIYIDLGCSGMPIKVFDYEKGKYFTYDPDLDRRDEWGEPKFNQVIPLYNVILNDFGEIAHNQTLAWRNIVTINHEIKKGLIQRREGESDEDYNKRYLNTYFTNGSLAERLIELSKKSRFDITDVQRSSYAYSLKAEKRAEDRYSVAQKEDEPATDDSAATVVVDYAGSASAAAASSTPPPSDDEASEFLAGGKRYNKSKKNRKKKRKRKKTLKKY